MVNVILSVLPMGNTCLPHSDIVRNARVGRLSDDCHHSLRISIVASVAFASTFSAFGRLPVGPLVTRVSPTAKSDCRAAEAVDVVARKSIVGFAEDLTAGAAASICCDLSLEATFRSPLAKI